MKKILLSLALLMSVPAMAQHHRGHSHNHYYGHGQRYNWVAPLVIGGVVTYALTRPEPRTVIIDQPVIVQKETVCSAWREIQQTDGSITRERTCYSQ